jgi:hypothetical protein
MRELRQVKRFDSYDITLFLIAGSIATADCRRRSLGRIALILGTFPQC